MSFALHCLRPRLACLSPTGLSSACPTYTTVVMSTPFPNQTDHLHTTGPSPGPLTDDVCMYVCMYVSLSLSLSLCRGPIPPSVTESNRVRPERSSPARPPIAHSPAARQQQPVTANYVLGYPIPTPNTGNAFFFSFPSGWLPGGTETRPHIPQSPEPRPRPT